MGRYEFVESVETLEPYKRMRCRPSTIIYWEREPISKGAILVCEHKKVFLLFHFWWPFFYIFSIRNANTIVYSIKLIGRKSPRGESIHQSLPAAQIRHCIERATVREFNVIIIVFFVRFLRNAVEMPLKNMCYFIDLYLKTRKKSELFRKFSRFKRENASENLSVRLSETKFSHFPLSIAKKKNWKKNGN